MFVESTLKEICRIWHKYREKQIYPFSRTIWRLQQKRKVLKEESWRTDNVLHVSNQSIKYHQAVKMFSRFILQCCQMLKKQVIRLTLLATHYEVELAVLAFFVSEKFYFKKKFVQYRLSIHINVTKTNLSRIGFRLMEWIISRKLIVPY